MSKYHRKMRRTEAAQLGSDRSVAILGIDPSLSGTGLALLVDGKITSFASWTDTKTNHKRNPDVLAFHKPPSPSTEVYRHARTDMIAKWMIDRIGKIHAKYKNLAVAMEGYAFNSKSTRASDIHEVCGLVKSNLIARKIPLRIYPPLSVKLAATGSGSADKGHMILACFRRYGLDVSTYGAAGENIADAVMIAAFLNDELDVRAGRVAIKGLVSHTRDALLRTTKAEPIALISRPLIDGRTLPDLAPVFETG